MTILDLKDQIIHKNLKNFYIFTGEEIGIINIYLEQMSKVLDMPIKRAESVLSIYDQCMGGSLFGDDTGFYVIRDDKDIMKQEKAYETISHDIGKNVIVLLYDKIDSRLKFGKYFKDCTVSFEKLTPSILKSYLYKALPMSDENIEKLMTICNYSYDTCMLEVDKIKSYMNANVKQLDNYNYEIKNSDLCFEELLSYGVIYQPEETDVFKFTEAVCMHKTQDALKLELILRENGVSSINILGTLYNSMKSVMLIQCCGKYDDIAEITGLDKGQIYFNKKYVGKYKIDMLVHSVKLINKVIEGVKNGWIDDAYATRYVLASIM